MTGTRPRVKDSRRHKQQTDESATASEDDRPTYYIASCRRQRSLQASGDPSHLRGRPYRLVTPIDHGTPKEAVRFKSMTLKEAYSVPKHTSAICVQSFDDSLNSAIHITYRISLRSSSLREPRYPLLKVVKFRLLFCVLNLSQR